MKFIEMSSQERVEIFNQVVTKAKQTQQEHGSLDCPVCNGKINFTVIKHSNRISFACNTSGCIRFMELNG